MILEKQEKKLMDIVYELASGTSNGQYLVTPQELLERITFKVDFRESDLETNLNRLMLDNYCSFEKAKKANGDMMYLITLKDNGISYLRDRQIARRKAVTRIIVTILIAALSFSIKSILQAIIG
ncbi:MAG: hypothetical protein J5781_00450 [Clostridia bacterium]|nr:hypothetical protein [Clostridia bacterium]